MKQYIMIIIPLVFLGILIGANIYLAKRYTYFLNLTTVWPMVITFVAITLFSFFGMFSMINSTSVIGHITYITAATLLGFVLYVLISTIAIDLVGLLVKMQPLNQAIISVAIALTISIYGILNANIVRVNEVDINISGLNNNIRAAHLTDTHIGHMRSGKTLQKVVGKINDQSVDVVFFTGDLLDSKITLTESSMKPLGNLNAPIYFVEGNHDEYTGVDAIKDYLRSIGVIVLENEIKNFQDLQIIGLTYMNADEKQVGPHTNANGPNVKAILADLDPDPNKPSVLLHHGPNGIKYASDAGVDLYLAGHTHGGQLWPITHFAGLIFEYNKGLHKHNETQVYVSQGTGTFGPPMRVGTYSELTILNLKQD
jgi:predicted MPP superfamily phosphohydrolase